MGINQAIRVAFGSLVSNKLRSILTILGMGIGVGAVITLMSIGQGAQAAVQAQFNSLGTNLIFVQPGTTSSGGVRAQAGSVNTLTYDDAQAVADPNNVPDASLVSPELTTGAQFVYQSQNTFGRVFGITSAYSEAHNYNVQQGSWLSDDQVQGNANVVVLGSVAAQTLFGTTNPIGLNVRLSAGPTGSTGSNGQRTGLFQVIGVGEAKGGSGFDNPDTAVYIPITTAMDKFSRQTTGAGAKTVSQITVQAASAAQLGPVEQEINQLLMQRHHISDPTQLDFSVTSQQDQLQTRQNITGVLTIFLGAVAGISLVVGGIGIMNIMIVSVTERTREIGIRKAIGARKNDILMQFLVESMLVSLLGGLSGILAGVGVSALVNGQKLNGQALQTLVTPQSIVLAVGVAAAIGIFFGLYPAYRAASLRPIEALHYE
ncbi:MAG TPA: ABC transporter permease [Dehalococcoidia bacterium]|nr:ABC transporter permease [Dehalococcoidia bacterium]